MGRKKLPIDQLKENGNYRPSRHGEHHLTTSVSKSIPKPPSRFNRYARDEWRRITKELHSLGMLSNIDLGALGLLCEQYGRALEIDFHIRSKFNGWAAYLATVDYKTDMHGKAYNSAVEYYFKNLGLFGISPAERAKIQIHSEETPEKKKINQFKPL